MISFSCPSCGYRVETDDVMKGRKATCPGCGGSVTVPSTDTAAPEQVPAASAPVAPPVEAMAGVEDEDRCPKCGARASAAADNCAFCGASLGRAAVGKAEPTVTEKKAAKRSAITAVLSVLWTLAMGAVIVTILAAPEAAPASPEEEAAGNLQLLQDALERMQASGKVPTSLGGTFWKEVADAEDATAALVSSAAALQGFTGATSVRGPSRPYAQIEETGVVACERAGSLPGATVVLYKNGTIETVGEQTDAYRRAITETQE